MNILFTKILKDNNSIIISEINGLYMLHAFLPNVYQICDGNFKELSNNRLQWVTSASITSNNIDEIIEKLKENLESKKREWVAIEMILSEILLFKAGQNDNK